MGNISHYKNFLNEADEPVKPVKGEKKLMKIFISPRLTDILMKLTKFPDSMVKIVTNRILGLTKTDDLFDKSYLDFVDGKMDLISFMPAARAWRSMEFKDQDDANKQPTPDCPMWNASARQTQSIGKFINYKFGNAFRAEISALFIYDNFKLITGEDIRKWYNEKNYAPVGGNLNTSCMRYDKCQSYMDLYCAYPDKIGLLILTDENNKLLGRALIWKGLRKPTDKTLMDRIYTTKSSEEELFKKYAAEKGWLHKYQQAASDNSYVENGQRVQKSVALQLLPPKSFKQYPYMDTMKYYNPGTGRMGSDAGNPVEGKRRIKLESTDGSYQNID
jgi:hypothetical protein